MNTFQPKGYFPLFFIFMFERMYFYGVRALLVLFMIKHLMFSTDKASSYYGWYLAALSFSPVIGGFISDIWLGRKKALLWSIIVAIFGCVLLAVSSLASSALLFYAATFFIVVGAMLFRPTIYTTLGEIYDSGNDPRRDGGFTLIFLAINVGAFFAPLACGTLGERFGWWPGFLAASIFMVAILFLLKQVTTNIDPKTTSTEPSNKNVLFITLLVIFAVYLPYHLANNSIDTASFSGAVIGGMLIPSSWIQGLLLVPAFIFYLIFPWVWIKLARVNKEPSTIYKFVWGLGFLLLALLVYNFVVVGYVKSGGTVGLSMIGITGIILALSEVCIGPIITSLITKIAPKKWAATFVGGWFTIIGVASIFISYVFEFIIKKGPVLTISLTICSILVLVYLSKAFKRWTWR